MTVFKLFIERCCSLAVVACAGSELIAPNQTTTIVLYSIDYAGYIMFLVYENYDIVL